MYPWAALLKSQQWHRASLALERTLEMPIPFSLVGLVKANAIVFDLDSKYGLHQNQRILEQSGTRVFDDIGYDSWTMRKSRISCSESMADTSPSLIRERRSENEAG
ncbi:MAG: hypothetical protein IPO65_10150 [Saprospiraceae bacterium]|nr:hypothetical protein [Saprospiraceae bacterium]